MIHAISTVGDIDSWMKVYERLWWRWGLYILHCSNTSSSHTDMEIHKKRVVEDYSILQMILW